MNPEKPRYTAYGYLYREIMDTKGSLPMKEAERYRAFIRKNKDMFSSELQIAELLEIINGKQKGVSS